MEEEAEKKTKEEEKAEKKEREENKEGGDGRGGGEEDEEGRGGGEEDEKARGGCRKVGRRYHRRESGNAKQWLAKRRLNAKQRKNLPMHLGMIGRPSTRWSRPIRNAGGG